MSVAKAWGKRTALALAIVLLVEAPASAGFIEEVYLAKIGTNDDRAVIRRSSGEIYLIEKGNGCLSLWRYEGGRVLIVYPTLFLGLGSRLLIPEAHQHCSIWTVTRSRLWDGSFWFSVGGERN
jgi:hypothetical protein